MYFIQPVPDMLNVVIVEVLREQKIFSTTSIERLGAHGRDVGDVKLVIVIFKRRQMDIEIEIKIVYNIYRVRRFTTCTECAGCCLWALPTMPFRKLTSQG
jgi:hypothetical protein